MLCAYHPSGNFKSWKDNSCILDNLLMRFFVGAMDIERITKTYISFIGNKVWTLKVNNSEYRKLIPSFIVYLFMKDLSRARVGMLGELIESNILENTQIAISLFLYFYMFGSQHVKVRVEENGQLFVNDKMVQSCTISG
jgi:hypothetical protein